MTPWIEECRRLLGTENKPKTVLLGHDLYEWAWQRGTDNIAFAMPPPPGEVFGGSVSLKVLPDFTGDARAYRIAGEAGATLAEGRA